MLKSKFFFFSIATLILISVAIYLEKFSSDSSLHHRLDIKPDQMNHLAVTKSQDIKIFGKSNQKWEIINSPIEADSVFLNTIVGHLTETQFSQINLDQESSLMQFRFDQPLATIEWKNRNPSISATNRLVISERKNFEGQTYYQLFENGKQYVLIGSSDLASEISKPWIFFQKKHLFDYNIEQVKTIKIKSLNQNFTLKAPFENLEKVDAFLSQVRQLSAQEYFENRLPSLVSPLLEVEIIFDQAAWKMSLSLNSKEKRLYAQISNLNNQIYHVEYSTSYWEYFANLTPKQFAKDNQ